MKNYIVKITETYSYEVQVNANDRDDAILKAKDYYKNTEDGILGVADANSFEKVSFKLISKNNSRYFEHKGSG